MRPRSWATGLAVALALGATLLGPALLRPEIRVAPGHFLQEAIDAAPDGARIVLDGGDHQGPITIDKPLELLGSGARIVAGEVAGAALSVFADGVRIEGIATEGADTGIRVREAEAVALEDVSVRRARYHGIEIVDSAARVSRAEVGELLDGYAQGIEVRNSDGRPDSIIEGSSVTGGQEGIVSHVSEVVIADNIVRDTTLRGITVTEMSDGIVHDNVVEDAVGVGLYCGDMSRCEFRGNHVHRVEANPLSRATAGWGLVVTYHSVASSSDDVLRGAAGAVFASIDGRLRDRTPFELGAGMAALRPVILTVLVTLAVMAVAFALARRVAMKLGARVSPGHEARWIVPVGVAGLLVQTFHMVEHGLQVFRVRFDGLPSRGGLVGPAVEAEWVHFIYNALVLAGIVAVVIARRHGWKPPGKLFLGDTFLIVALAIQGYHMVEHSTKLAQHIAGGAKVNPGITGNFVDLVLLHFGINLAVYLACVAVAACYALAGRSKRAAAPAPGYAALRG